MKPRRLLLLVVGLAVAAGCADQKVMPPPVEAGIGRLNDAFQKGDAQAVCAAVAYVEPRLRAWENEERDSFSIFGVSGRRARAIELERRQLREWHAACALNKVTAARLTPMQESWTSAVDTLQLVGTVPGWRRTATGLLAAGVLVVAGVLVWFAIAFRLRARRDARELAKLRKDEDD